MLFEGQWRPLQPCDGLTPMRVIRVTVDRRAEGIRVEVAMSPSVLDELAESFYESGSVRFNDDEDLAIELDIDVGDFEPGGGTPGSTSACGV
jgi:hypothetical protein